MKWPIHHITEYQFCKPGLNLHQSGWRIIWPWFWGNVGFEWNYNRRRFYWLSQYQEQSFHHRTAWNNPPPRPPMCPWCGEIVGKCDHLEPTRK